MHSFLTPPPLPKIRGGRGGVLVFEIWAKKMGVMKKLLRDRGLAERGGSLRKGGGGFPNCFIIFLSEKVSLYTIGTLFFVW